jgi:NAD(P)-dependent dehydrogenase (short-subunit alcohol dehydrogenase family)
LPFHKVSATGELLRLSIQAETLSNLSAPYRNVNFHPGEMKRLGQPREVASAAALAAPQDESYICGVEISVDGRLEQV